MVGWRIKCKGIQNTIRGGIHGNITKLKQKLESHLSQYMCTVASSNNVQAEGTKLVDLILNLENSTFRNSDRTHGPRRIEPKDVGHILNSFRDDEYYHDKYDEP